MRVAEFAYQNDALAEMIVRAWTEQGYEQTLRQDPQSELADRGIHLDNPTVISESEYYGGYVTGDSTEVVFVLPDKGRIETDAQGNPKTKNLLETAKLLMACTPNGI